MLRKATAADLNAVVTLRCAAARTDRAEAEGWAKRIAGLENILLLENAPGAPPAAMLAAIPVEYGLRQGVWFSGMAQRPDTDKALMGRLLQSCLRAYATRECDFAVAIPAGASGAAALKKLGFQNLFPLRAVRRPIERDLLARAEFDSLTVRRLLQMRGRYQPGCISLPETAMNEMMTQLYRRGATVVSDRSGYGIFYVDKGRQVLQFLELQADSDHRADVLLQAAREKTGASTAHILLGEHQALYPGAGRRCAYGMMAFLRQPFPVEDVYFRMLL